MKYNSSPILIAISGVKNSGKTTLIERLIPRLSCEGLKVATIKHDGHDFECDIEGTDTFKHKKAGAYGTAIFSKNKFMVIKEQKHTNEEELISYFKDADIILLEGFKYSNYPKIEVIRQENSSVSVCKEETLLAIASDIESLETNVKVININDIESIGKLIIEYVRRSKHEGCI